MSLSETKAQYENKLIAKPDYIEKMYHFHQQLFQYANYIKETDIAKIEIQDQQVIMTTRTRGIKILCNFPDNRATPIEILNFSFYEKEDAEMIFRLIQPQFTVFDIGANIGWYTLNIATQFKDVQLYAFEPIPYTFELLTKNVLLNNLQQVKLFNFGFSNQEKELIFYLNQGLLGGVSAENVSGNDQAEKIPAMVKRLDDFMLANKIKNLDFIKCDVEGGELLVFQGGLGTLKKYQPIIFCEMLRKWSEKFNYHPNDIIQLLANVGYRCFFAKNNKLIEFFLMDKDTTETNFFFLSPKHIKQFAKLFN